MSDRAHELRAAHEALDLAASILRSSTPGLVTAKDDRDYASETDTTIERRVRELLRERTPEAGFLGEEDGHQGDRDRERYWVLDPIDGTSNYLHSLPLCAVSLALVEAGVEVVGGIDVPFLGDRYAAVQGQGATVNGAPIEVRRTRALHEGIVALGDYAVGAGSEAKNRARFALTQRVAERAERVRMLGSAAISLAWLAHGRFDAAITLSNKPWDMAAGVLIAREAGAQVIDLDGSEHTLTSSATIAAAPTLIDEVLAVAATASRANG